MRRRVKKKDRRLKLGRNFSVAGNFHPVPDLDKHECQEGFKAKE